MRLSDSTLLNIENDPSKSHEVTGAYLRDLGRSEPILNFIAASSFSLSTFWFQSCKEGK